MPFGRLNRKTPKETPKKNLLFLYVVWYNYYGEKGKGKMAINKEGVKMKTRKEFSRGLKRLLTLLLISGVGFFLTSLVWAECCRVTIGGDNYSGCDPLYNQPIIVTIEQDGPVEDTPEAIIKRFLVRSGAGFNKGERNLECVIRVENPKLEIEVVEDFQPNPTPPVGISTPTGVNPNDVWDIRNSVDRAAIMGYAWAVPFYNGFIAGTDIPLGESSGSGEYIFNLAREGTNGNNALVYETSLEYRILASSPQLLYWRVRDNLINSGSEPSEADQAAFDYVSGVLRQGEQVYNSFIAGGVSPGLAAEMTEEWEAWRLGFRFSGRPITGEEGIAFYTSEGTFMVPIGLDENGYPVYTVAHTANNTLRDPVTGVVLRPGDDGFDELMREQAGATRLTNFGDGTLATADDIYRSRIALQLPLNYNSSPSRNLSPSTGSFQLYNSSLDRMSDQWYNQLVYSSNNERTGSLLNPLGLPNNSQLYTTITTNPYDGISVRSETRNLFQYDLSAMRQWSDEILSNIDSQSELAQTIRDNRVVIDLSEQSANAAHETINNGRPLSTYNSQIRTAEIYTEAARQNTQRALNIYNAERDGSETGNQLLNLYNQTNTARTNLVGYDQTTITNERNFPLQTYSANSRQSLVTFYNRPFDPDG